MKRFFIVHSLLLALLFQACEKRERLIVEYEKNPVFTWGQASYFGDCYINYDIENHVLGLYAFTDSLKINDKGKLEGFGQYLYLDDIYIAPINPGRDTIFSSGVYTVSASREAMTIEPGSVYKGDSIKMEMDIGAMIHYIEKVDRFTTRKFIEDGTMTVSYKGDSIIRFDFDFILDDKTELTAVFETDQLPIYNDAVSKEATRKKMLDLLKHELN